MNGETSGNHSSGNDTCWLSRALCRSVPRRPLRRGVLALRPRSPRELRLVVQDPAPGASATPPPPPQEMELGPRRRLLLGCGGRRGLDEVLLALQVEGAAHALAEAESGGGAGVAVHRARVEAVRQVANGIDLFKLKKCYSQNDFITFKMILFSTLIICHK